MSAALTAEGLNTFYGKSHILRRGSGHGPARPRRRRQDHDAAQPDGAHPPREGRVSVFGRETTRWPPLRWARSLARRHPRVFVLEGGGVKAAWPALTLRRPFPSMDGLAAAIARYRSVERPWRGHGRP